MFDISNLDKYVLVPTTDADPASIEDLRALEADFGPGVYPLWSDARQSIVAFAFEPHLFSPQEAAEWVRQAQEKRSAELSLLDILQAVVNPIARAISTLLHRGDDSEPSGEALRSFGETRRLVERALYTRLAGHAPEDQLTPTDGPWIIDIGPSSAVVEWQGETYALSYTLDPEGVVTLGALEPVTQRWTRENGSPVVLHRFDVHLGAGDEAAEDDGLIWKELIHPGQWFKSDTGRLVEVTTKIIKAAFKAWQAGLPKYISVPTDSHHQQSGGLVPPESNRGFVKKLKLIGDRLFGGFAFTDPEVARGVALGSIADCSVFLEPDVIHPQTGESFDWVLSHVLLTNDPLVQDLAPFGALPASRADAAPGLIICYQEVSNMEGQQQGQQGQPQGPPQTLPQPAPSPEIIELNAGDRAVLDSARILGLSAEDLRRMVEERTEIQRRARDLEITRIVRALEGREQHPAVVHVEGRRHFPVVCAAVERALREQPQALALSAGDDGTTPLDTVVLAIANAIPADARQALAAGDPPAGNRLPEAQDPTLQPANAPPTDEQIADLDRRLR
jgi:hypothetical protein